MSMWVQKFTFRYRFVLCIVFILKIYFSCIYITHNESSVLEMKQFYSGSKSRRIYVFSNKPKFRDFSGPVVMADSRSGKSLKRLVWKNKCNFKSEKNNSICNLLQSRKPRNKICQVCFEIMNHQAYSLRTQFKLRLETMLSPYDCLLCTLILH